MKVISGVSKCETNEMEQYDVEFEESAVDSIAPAPLSSVQPSTPSGSVRTASERARS